MERSQIQATIKQIIDQPICDFLAQEDLSLPGRSNATAIATAIESLATQKTLIEFLAVVQSAMVKQIVVVLRQREGGKQIYLCSHKEGFGVPVIPFDRNYAENPIHVAARLTELLKSFDNSRIVRLTDLIDNRATSQ